MLTSSGYLYSDHRPMVLEKFFGTRYSFGYKCIIYCNFSSVDNVYIRVYVYYFLTTVTIIKI